MEKRIRLRNFVFTLNNPSITPQELLERCEKVKDLRFIIFQFELGAENEKPHFQGYLEFGKHKSFKVINQQLFDNLSHIEGRRGSQKEAIDYCTDKTKKLVCQDTYRGGQPKVDYQAWNKSDKDIPLNREEQGMCIDKRIIAGEYSSLEDIRRDFPYLVIHHPGKLQELIHYHNPIDFFKLVPAEVIGLHGETGVGKSCLNSQFLQERGFSGTDVTYMKSDLETVCYFSYSDEQKRVLVLEEVRQEGPKYNSIINWIDKKTFLPVKGGLIRNNFELIIINSLVKPGEIYREIPLYRKIEALRRIYEGEVYQVELNEQSLKETKKKLEQKVITSGEFKFLYQPHFKLDRGIPDEIRDKLAS